MKQGSSHHRAGRLALTVLATSVVGLALAGPAAAEPAEVFSAGGTFNSTSESGTGAMTSNASVQGLDAAPQLEKRDQVIADNFGRVNAGLQVEGGTTYRVTATLDGASASEQATGEATARGFAEMEIYDCCFAGETTFLTRKTAELPSAPGQVTVTADVYVAKDTMLTPNVELHSYAAAYTDTTDTAGVEASTDTTSIDITALGEPTPEEPPAEEPAKPKRCLLFLCL